MSIKDSIEVRNLLSSDYANLIDFFIQAYGATTVFQNIDFLKYYFSYQINSDNKKNYCLIAMDATKKKIVSHYGGLAYGIQLNTHLQTTAVWGVNAFTLPEYRGQGINSHIVDIIHKSNPVNATIGFSYQTSHFYKNLGYNVFNHQRLRRYIYLMNDSAIKIINFLNSDLVHNNNLFAIATLHNVKFDSNMVTELTALNINTYNLDFNVDNIATTYRNLEFLNWRLLKNPYIKYKVYAYTENYKIKAYIAIRIETLEPQNYKISRVIDMFGNAEFIETLLAYTKHQALLNQHIYIDFSVFGHLYDSVLLQSGFLHLENEDYSLFPQVTAPIEKRTNNEYIAIQSKEYSSEINHLNENNCYFTRIDSDRDRIAKISQINSKA